MSAKYQYLGLQLLNLHMIPSNPPVHDVLTLSQLVVLLVETLFHGVVCLDHLLQQTCQFSPSILCLLVELLNGLVDLHNVVKLRVYVDNCGTALLLQLADPGLQAIILRANQFPNQEREWICTDPLFFSSHHNPEVFHQAHSETHQGVPRLVNGRHIPSPDIDQVVQDLIR